MRRAAAAMKVATELFIVLVIATIYMRGTYSARSYRIIITNVSILTSDEEWIENPQFTSKLVNGTVNVLSSSFGLKKEITREIKSKWQAYERYGRNREYVASLHAEGTACGDIDKHLKNEMIYKGIPFIKLGFTSCPMKKGYHSGSAILKNDDFPPVLPGTHWRLDNEWLYGSKVIQKVRIDSTIQRLTGK